jgi:hypothetical protein
VGVSKSDENQNKEIFETENDTTDLCVKDFSGLIISMP